MSDNAIQVAANELTATSQAVAGEESRVADFIALLKPRVMSLVVFTGFAGLYVAYFMTGPRVAWWGEVGGLWWYRTELAEAAPMFTAHLVLLAGLVAMTMIDARTFTIPIQIPLVVTVVAFCAHAIQAFIPPVAGG